MRIAVDRKTIVVVYTFVYTVVTGNSERHYISCRSPIASTLGPGSPPSNLRRHRRRSLLAPILCCDPLLRHVAFLRHFVPFRLAHYLKELENPSVWKKLETELSMLNQVGPLLRRVCLRARARVHFLHACTHLLRACERSSGSRGAHAAVRINRPL